MFLHGQDNRLNHFTMELKRHDLWILVDPLTGHCILNRLLCAYKMTQHAELWGRSRNIPSLFREILCQYVDMASHHGGLYTTA